ncbi:MAG: hypothetical protein WAM13_03865 [Candidatus Sulfotelmatobacter sp.]
MKKNGERRSNGDMRPEYDFTSMKGGVRGKYYERYRKGTNVVLLKPDVAEAFPTEDAVNEALRGILGTARAVRRTGGLPDRALQTSPRRPKRRSSRG